MSRSTTKGHVRRRGKTWTYVLYRGRDENGKRRYTWRGGFRTSREAQAALTEALQALGNRTFVERSDVTVAQWLRQWLQAERKNWRPSTLAGRVVAVENHLVPKLGHHRLQALTSQQVTAAYNELLENGHQRGGGLSARSVRIAHGVLRKALEEAVEERLLSINPAAKAKPPKVSVTTESARQARTYWTAGEVSSFLQGVRDDRLFALWYLAFASGLRRGELLGLHWRDLDLDAGVLRVAETLLEPRVQVERDGRKVWEYRLTLGPPKTKHSLRSVDLDEETVRVLKAHRTRQAEERLAFGPGWGTHHELAHDLVFRDEAGGPLVPHAVTYAFQQAVKTSGQRPLRLHDARHTHAALLAQALVPPKVMQERLGHHSAGFTLDFYGGTFPAQQREAAERFAALLHRV